MAEQYRGGHYDDDLTVGLNDTGDEGFDTGYVDLFEYVSEEESPISRLKTIMLSIEWEITDEVLISFNDELLSAQQIWSDDKVKLVYVQALQIISKYIYQKKSDSHPNAMKVLIAFFYDLEKIVLDTQISEEEKRHILFEDVKKFERLKRQLGLGAAPAKPERAAAVQEIPATEPKKAILEDADIHPDLYDLKAHILSIDWEITDKELSEISREVGELQRKWASSKPRRLLLQGIDALGGYIKLMKSRSHADSFKLLNSFYFALERVVDGNADYQETKELLLSEAAKFDRFKQEIAASITPEAIAHMRSGDAVTAAVDGQADASPVGEGALSIEETSEFEQAALAEDFGAEESFTEETLEKVASFFDEMEEAASDDFASLSSEEALQGVDVETEADDDSDEEALPTLADGVVAPALADLVEDIPDDASGGPAPPASPIVGVDVESEADDESDEEPLPTSEGELAPALFAGEGFEVDGSGVAGKEDGDTEISRHVDDFFSDDMFGEEVEDQEDQLDLSGEPITPALSGIGGNYDAYPGDESPGDDIEEELDSYLTEDGEDALTALDDERFGALKARIEELKTGISETNLSLVKNEIGEIKQALSNRPIEKTLINLISTVVHTIDAKTGETDDEAVELLQSVFSNLDRIRHSAVDQNHALELMASETEKILAWQQQRIRR
ncbi:MAG: hypothetical protein LJE64_04295 [Desulfofustis sp.]|jgi:pilus assembly protein FimV|nr:hypothetical protein [Desulfofustis sp.]